MTGHLSDSINDDVPVPSSRRLAQTWPFPRYYAYQRKMRETAKQWFDSKELPRDPKYAFIPDKWENWPSKTFNEDSGQPTSIDIALRDASGRPFVFIESKMMEAEFGSCTVLGMGDCAGKNPLPAKTGCYLHHIGRRYWTLAEKLGIASLSMQSLARHIEDSTRHADWIGEFRSKYGL